MTPSYQASHGRSASSRTITVSNRTDLAEEAILAHEIENVGRLPGCVQLQHHQLGCEASFHTDFEALPGSTRWGEGIRICRESAQAYVCANKRRKKAGEGDRRLMSMGGGSAPSSPTPVPRRTAPHLLHPAGEDGPDDLLRHEVHLRLFLVDGSRRDACGRVESCAIVGEVGQGNYMAEEVLFVRCKLQGHGLTPIDK